MRFVLAVAIAVAFSCAMSAAAQQQQSPDPDQTTTQSIVSPDGKLAVTLAGDALKVWDVATGRLIRALQTGSGVAAFSFTPDSSRLVVVSRDNKRRLWELTTGRLVDS